MTEPLNPRNPRKVGNTGSVGNTGNAGNAAVELLQNRFWASLWSIRSSQHLQERLQSIKEP